jgi:isopenicillin N synthase-like dioxygenase
LASKDIIARKEERRIASEMGPVPEALPIVSLKSKTLKDDLYKACKETGFFYLTDHGISAQTLTSILSLSRQFFLQAPKSEKAKMQRKSVEDGGDGARGYQVLNENVTKGKRDFHEAVDFYREWDDLLDREIPGTTFSNTEMDGLPRYKFLRGPNLWPEYPNVLKDVLQDYIDKCQVVGTAVVKAMGEALGEGDVFVKATRNSFWVLRMIGYPPLGVRVNYSSNLEANTANIVLISRMRTLVKESLAASTLTTVA